MAVTPGIGEVFRVGEVWMSPKGTFYKVVQEGVGRQMHLRVGIKGEGRKVFRKWDRISGWTRMSEDDIETHCQQWNIQR